MTGEITSLLEAGQVASLMAVLLAAPPPLPPSVAGASPHIVDLPARPLPNLVGFSRGKGESPDKGWLDVLLIVACVAIMAYGLLRHRYGPNHLETSGLTALISVTGNAPPLMCHHTDVQSLLAVAPLLLQQLTRAVEAADRMTSFRRPQPAVLREALEKHLLAGTCPPGADVFGALADLCDSFVKAKSSFGGIFSSKQARVTADLNQSADAAAAFEFCQRAWPLSDRLAMARWLHYVHDSGREHSCWQPFPDEASLTAHMAVCPRRPTLCPNQTHGCDQLVSVNRLAAHDSGCVFKMVPCTVGCGEPSCFNDAAICCTDSLSLSSTSHFGRLQV